MTPHRTAMLSEPVVDLPSGSERLLTSASEVIPGGVNSGNQCLDLTGHHQVIATGYSNPTPWDTERELPEPELKARLEGSRFSASTGTCTTAKASCISAGRFASIQAANTPRASSLGLIVEIAPGEVLSHQFVSG